MEAVSVVVDGSGDLCRAYGGEGLQASAPVAEPQGSFSVKGGGEQFLNILWGLVALGGVGAMFFLVILPSRGDAVEFDFKYPALVVGLLAFACWEIVRGIMKLSKIARRRVSLDGNGIRQDNASIAWPEIRSLKLFRKGDKLKPIAIINGSEEQTVEVVWATERLDYVMDAIISHLGADSRIEVV
jgi:hypothetical protein